MFRICSKIFIIAISSMLVAAIAYSETQEYKEYTVKRGDTLWDISSKEITDSFLWPKVWKENPEIKNPDLIYPGQRIRIPLYLLQKEVAPPPVEKAMPLPEVKPPVKVEKPVEIKPIEKEYLVDRDTLISSGYIADSVDSKGKITGSPDERALLGRGDYAYIETADPVKAGDKFYIIRSMGKVRHPETGEMMGYLIDVPGIVEVVGKESGEAKVKITASFHEVLVGDLLSDFIEIEPPFLVDNPRTPDISGFIVATKQRRILNGQLDIVYIDKGRRDGVEVGDLIGTVSVNKYSIPNGYIQVISTKEKTATAIIRKCNKEVTTGDKIASFVSR